PWETHWRFRSRWLLPNKRFVAGGAGFQRKRYVRERRHCAPQLERDPLDGASHLSSTLEWPSTNGWRNEFGARLVGARASPRRKCSAESDFSSMAICASACTVPS